MFTCELERASFTFGITNKCLIYKNQNKMNKAELIEAIAASSKLTKADAGKAITKKK